MKTKQTILKFVCVMGLGLVLSMSCSKDENSPLDKPGETPSPETGATLDEVLARGVVAPFPETATADTLSVSEPETKNYPGRVENEDEEEKEVEVRYVCTTKKVSVEDGNGTFPLFNPTAEIIWPGNLLQGKTLEKSTPSTINVDRAGNTISTNLALGNEVSAVTVDEITKGNVSTAINQIIASSPTEEVPAVFSLVVEDVYSEEQMALKMGISYESWTTKLEGSLDFTQDDRFSRVLVKLTQAYYTMSMDQVNGLDDIFAPEVTGDDLAPYVQADNPGTFISSVTYGRIFYMLVESTSSQTDLNAKIRGTYESFDKKIDGNVEFSKYESLYETKTKVFAYGGSAASTFELTGEIEIEEIANKLAESTNIRTALPLSYIARSIKNPDTIVGTKLATEYDRVECELKGILPPPGYFELVDVFEDGYGAATQIRREFTALFNGAGTEYVIFDGKNKGPVSERYSIKDENGPLGVTTFDAVGAALRQFEDEIHIFNKEGTQYEILEYGDAIINTAPTTTIGSYRKDNGVNRRFFVDAVFTMENGAPEDFTVIGPDGRTPPCIQFPLISKGIKAAVRRDIYEQSVGSYQEGSTVYLVKGEVTSTYFYPNDNNGATFSRRNYYNPFSIRKRNGDTMGFADFNCWETETPVSGARGTVEAACKVNYNDEVNQLLFFTADGLLVVRSLDGVPEQGPWAL